MRTLVLRALPEGADVREGFVSAGGNSLAALRLVTTLVKECRIRVPITNVLRSTSVTALIGELVDALPIEADQGSEGTAPGALSIAERQMLLEQTLGLTSAHLVAVEMEFSGKLDVLTLESAMRDVVARHDALRTRFWFDGDEFRREVVADALPEISHHVAASEDDLPGLRVRELSARTDPDGPRVPRFALVRLADDRHVLITVVHHLTCDGWSLNLFFDELAELYSARIDHRRPAPPPSAVAPKATYSATGLDFWTARLADVPDPVTIPPDRPRPNVQSFDAGRVTMDLSGALLDKLRAAAQAEGATEFAGRLAVWMLLVSSRAGAQDICVAVPVSGRTSAAHASTMGMFVNTVVIRQRMVGSMPFTAFVRSVHHRLLEAQDHQDVPFPDVVNALVPRRTLDRQPLAQVMMAMQPSGRRRYTLSDGVIAHATINLGVAEHSRFDVVLHFDGSEGMQQGWIDYDSALYRRETVSRLGADYSAMVSAVTAAPSTTVHDLVSAMRTSP
ncbi:condensation domain-containing protein [Streptomyces sp. NPDC002742]|uniref:condensation domain-containing protein n=1 Tax=Streptomyces sp. NPDC002742 TaxID=3364663 RepID=UPI0036C92D84